MRWAVAQRPKTGEKLCGDDYAVVPGEPRWLFSVIDGLGHGPEAHAAARAAREVIEARAELPLDQLMAELGRAMQRLRGACVALLRIDQAASTLQCASIGNVEIVALARAPIRPICSPGVVGRSVRKLHVFDFPLAPGDRLALFSDGISRRLELAPYRPLGPKEAADAILRDHGISHDDATCLIIDYG